MLIAHQRLRVSQTILMGFVERLASGSFQAFVKPTPDGCT
jgi:hypothetical protein